MPIKTNIGVSRKVADNNYGSRGASVNLEVELDSSMIQEPERLQDRIRQVFRLAQQSVDEELARQTTASGHNSATPPVAANGTNANGNGASGTNTNGANGNHGNGSTTNGNAGVTNGNGHRNGNSGHGASGKQLDYARQLAKGISGLGVRRLETLAQKMYGKPLAALSTMDASGLIDTLKSVKAGEINLDAALEGTAA
jgi:hypothetical protein